jgi:hypothetical protein
MQTLARPATRDSTSAVASADGSAKITTTGLWSNKSIEESVIVFNMLGQLTQLFNLVQSIKASSSRENELFSSASYLFTVLGSIGYVKF